MGTYYELRCMDCDDCGGVYADRNQRAAEVAKSIAGPVARFAREIAALPTESVERDLPRILHVSLGEILDYSVTLDLEWFAIHGEHKLTVGNGYGYDVDQCNAYVRTHKGEEQCALPHGHEGSHAVDGPHRRRERNKDR